MVATTADEQPTLRAAKGVTARAHTTATADAAPASPEPGANPPKAGHVAEPGARRAHDEVRRRGSLALERRDPWEPVEEPPREQDAAPAARR